MVSISSGDFSGKAAARLARPIRCSRSSGPISAQNPAEQIGGLDRVEIAGGAQQRRSSARRRPLRRAAWWRRAGALWCGAGDASGPVTMAVACDHRSAHHVIAVRPVRGSGSAGILAAEAERIRHHRGDPRVARLVGYHVERDRRIRNVVIDGRRNALVLERQQREDRLDRARPPKGCGRPSICWRRPESARCARRTPCEMPRYSILSFSGVAGAMGVDVVDLVRRSGRHPPARCACSR